MSGGKLFATLTPLQTISQVQNDLFPFANTLDIDISNYMSIVLNHSRVTDEDKLFIQNGVKWLNEESVQEYKKIYTELSTPQRQNILNIIAKERWGESWIDTILTYIMEAIFSDPIYGVNRQRAGEKWLNFENGMPHPKEALL